VERPSIDFKIFNRKGCLILSIKSKHRLPITILEQIGNIVVKAVPNVMLCSVIMSHFMKKYKYDYPQPNFHTVDP
jgi:hypothetical protein